MKKISPFAFTLLSLIFVGCAGRMPIAPGEVPPAAFVSAEDEQYGQQVFNELIDEFPISHDDSKIRRVREIVDKIAVVIHAQELPWHIYVLEAPEVKNAAATKGNFIFVWSGMIDAVQNDDELAAILAHEISHVLAGHTQPTPMEEVAQALAGVSGGIAGGFAGVNSGEQVIAKLAEALTREAMEAIFVDPESRRKELEADQIGLLIMADAGYDPHAAVGFWKRMSQTGEVDAPIAILSSHPQSADRFSALERSMPQAEVRYNLTKSGGLNKSSEWEAKQPSISNSPKHPSPRELGPSLSKKNVDRKSDTESSSDLNHAKEFSSKVEKNDAGEWVSTPE